jgi:hypothetical protein
VVDVVSWARSASVPKILSVWLPLISVHEAASFAPSGEMSMS